MWKITMSWLGAIGAAVGSIRLEQWAVIVAMLGGLAALFYTCLQIYVLWRDKILRGPGRRGKHTRRSDLE